MIIKPIHERRKAIEYGSMIEIRVPRPESSSYFFINLSYSFSLFRIIIVYIYILEYF